jgi:hypothetical protein
MDQLNTPLSWALLLVAVIVCVLDRNNVLERLRVSQFYLHIVAAKQLTNAQPKQLPKAGPSPTQKPSLEDPYLAIEPLPNFDLNNEEPLKLRPFKPKFHMTMGTPSPPNYPCPAKRYLTPSPQP